MVKKNDYGTQRINHDFQHSLNYDSQEVIEYKHQIFHVNDQIMMIHNNYDLDYFNGDMGIVRKIENETLTIELEGKKKFWRSLQQIWMMYSYLMQSQFINRKGQSIKVEVLSCQQHHLSC